MEDLQKERLHQILPLLVEHIRPKTIMAAPLRIGGSFYGAIELLDKKDGSSYTLVEKEALEVCMHMLEKVLEVRFLS